MIIFYSLILRFPGKSLEDVLVSLMADEDVLTLLKYALECKEIELCIEADVSLVEQQLLEVMNEIMIEDIVEENMVSEAVKQGMVNEPAKQGMVSEPKKKGICQSCIGETVGILVSDTEVPLTLVVNVKQTVAMEQLKAFSFRNLLEHIAFEDIVVDLQQEPYHGVDQEKEIANMLVELNPPNEDAVFQCNESEYEGLVDGDESDFDNEGSYTPKREFEVVM
ncbi:hypothetical protein Tco_1443903 [Tanacetum coccineum]